MHHLRRIVGLSGLSLMSALWLWAQAPPSSPPADQPRMRADRNSHLAHQQLLAKAKSGRIDVYFVGDSITRRWGALDYPDFLAELLGPPAATDHAPPPTGDPSAP